MSTKALLLILWAVFAQSNAQVPSNEPCPNYVPIQNFNITKYMGVWYEIERFFAIFEIGGRCNSANYTLQNNGIVKVVNSHIIKSTGRLDSIVGSAKPAGTAGDGKLEVTFPTSNSSAPYWVLDTDYDSYAVVWSCTNITASVSARTSWILGRNRVLSSRTSSSVDAVIAKFKIDKSKYLKTEQVNCSTNDVD